MKFRKLGNSDLDVSLITFGAWAAGGWLWGSSDRNDAIKAIQAGFDEGVTTIDTAPVYGQGTSEEIVGEAIKNIPRDKVQIITKFGMHWDLPEAKGDFAMHSEDHKGNKIDIYRYSGKRSVIKECEDSLRRLGTDYIDLYQIHFPDTTTPIEETFEAVVQLIKEGKVRYAGVCNYEVEQMQKAENIVPVISNQLPYALTRRKIENTIIPYALEKNIGVLAYSPLMRGLLTGKISPEHRFSEGDSRAESRFYTRENIIRTNKLLDELRPLAKDKNVSLAQLVLRWTTLQPGIISALAGARNAEQSIQNAKSMQFDLNPEEVNFITERSNSFVEID